MSFFFELGDGIQAFRHPRLQHRQTVEGNIRASGGVGGRREVVGVGFAGNFEDGDGDGFWEFGTTGKPICICPGIDDLFGVGVALGEFEDVVEGIENEECFTQCRRRSRSNIAIFRFKQFH